MTEINRGLLNHSGNHKNNKEKVMTELENEINRKKYILGKKLKLMTVSMTEIIRGF